MKIEKLQEAFALAYQGGHHKIADLIWQGCHGNGATATVPPPKPAPPSNRQVKPPRAIGVKSQRPAQDSVLKILREFGPLTTAEVGTHAYPKQKSAGRASAAASAVLQDLRRAKLAERREDPDSRLEKWFAVG
jgi:hypothetical protein